MKKLLLIAVAAFLSVTAGAQTLTYGPVIGVNLNNLNVPSFGGVSVDNKMRVGYMIGGFAQYGKIGKWAFRGELAYSSQGTKINYLMDGKDHSGAVRVSYINIPLMAKYYIANGFNIAAGPQIGFNVGNNFVGDAGVFSDNSNFRALDFSVNVGLGYDITDKVDFGVRYNIGTVNAIRRYEGESKLSKNGVVQIYLSIALGQN